MTRSVCRTGAPVLILAVVLGLTMIACAGTYPDDSQSDPQTEGDGLNAAPIPLIAWVDLLVEEYDEENARPDTVAEKNILDDEQAGSFEKFFATKKQ